MDVSKAPPLPLEPVTSRGTGSTLAAPSGIALPGAAAPDPGVSDAASLLLDEFHIEPLDIGGALQIFVAEAAAGLGASSTPGAGATPRVGSIPGAGAMFGAGTVSSAGAMFDTVAGFRASVDAQVAAPHAVLQLFLHALPPAGLEPAFFLDAVHGLESGLHQALDDAVSVVAAWRAVPPAAVDGVREARALVLAALTDDPPNPLWLRPEWLGLAAPMERFWRRRRLARRALRDPDLHSEWHDTRDSDDPQQQEPGRGETAP